MDDNKMLTLASNERVPLKANMRLVFEIRDLVYATPATVSRAGILYISTDKGTQWRSLIESWVQRRDSQGLISDLQGNALRGHFTKYVADTGVTSTLETYMALGHALSKKYANLAPETTGRVALYKLQIASDKDM